MPIHDDIVTLTRSDLDASIVGRSANMIYSDEVPIDPFAGVDTATHATMVDDMRRHMDRVREAYDIERRVPVPAPIQYWRGIDSLGGPARYTIGQRYNSCDVQQALRTPPTSWDPTMPIPDLPPLGTVIRAVSSNRPDAPLHLLYCAHQFTTGGVGQYLKDTTNGDLYLASSWPEIVITRNHESARNTGIRYRMASIETPTPYPWAWGAVPVKHRTAHFVHSKVRIAVTMDSNDSHYRTVAYLTSSHPWYGKGMDVINELHGEFVPNRPLDHFPYRQSCIGYSFDRHWHNDLVCSLQHMLMAQRDELPPALVWRDKKYAVECGIKLAEATYAAAKAVGVNLRQPQVNADDCTIEEALCQT